MEELSYILRVLLKRIPYQVFLQARLNCMNLKLEKMENIIHGYMPSYSDTEIRNMLESLKIFLHAYNQFIGTKSVNGHLSVFDAVFRFSDGMLTRRNNKVLIQYERILRWRVTTKDVSEDIFVTAFLARHDLQSGIYCRDFTWPFVISHNNIQLRKITEKGMAENHFHLWGSTPSFLVSWIWMMNHMIDVEQGIEIDSLMQKSRTVFVDAAPNNYDRDMKKSCLQAALIRFYLYSVLVDVPLEFGKYYIKWQSLKFWIKQFSSVIDLKIEEVKGFNSSQLLDYIADESLRKYLPSLKRILNKRVVDFKDFQRHEYTVRISDVLEVLFEKQGEICLQDCCDFFPDDKYRQLLHSEAYRKVMFYLSEYNVMCDCLDHIQDELEKVTQIAGENYYDYALSSIKFHNYLEIENNYILSGERWFLYEMFRRIETRDHLLTSQMYNLFYAYLIIRERFHGEMVQSNDWIGFENFYIYQRKAGVFSKEPFLEELKAKMAVESCFEQNVKYLELRITPQNSAKKNCGEIQFLDRAIGLNEKKTEFYYYVFHFIKQQDEEQSGLPFCDFRHAAFRRDVAKKVMALLEFRRLYPKTAARVLGIDAAAQEIGCRPEVFAQGFRVLHKDTSYVYSDKGFIKLPQLRITYHVGEDFLDVVDGLRAIDEAILFLNLDCGDRLGHALALGICVNDWYQSKQNHIWLKQQDYLDNIVWLYHALVRYRIFCMDNLKNRIEEEYSKYFDEIYGSNIDEQYITEISKVDGNVLYKSPLVFDIHAYYGAWKLRGDAPELYRRGYYYNSGTYMTPYETNAVNYSFPSEFDIRKKREVSILYHYYHYNTAVREAGSKMVNIKVDHEYIKGVELVQKAMQWEIARRGIGIETNPSSNVSIGTFSRYDEHPITRFFNNGLVVNESVLKDCPQLWVSINTDDQGIFGTKLENEYALLARALEKKTDEKGKYIYSKSLIYEWLDKIREMGLRQSFIGKRKIIDQLRINEDDNIHSKLFKKLDPDDFE